MVKDWSLERQLAAGFLAVALVMLAALLVTVRNTDQLQETTERVVHTQEVLAGLDDVLASVIDAQAATRGYLLTGNDEYLGYYEQARDSFSGQVERLRMLLSDNPDQTGHLSQLEALLRNQFQFRAQLIETARARGMEVATQIIESGTGRSDVNAIRAKVAFMRGIEQRLLLERRNRSEAAHQVAMLTLVVLALLVIAAVAGSYLATRRHMVMRTRAESALRDLNQTLEERVRERTLQLEQSTVALAENEARLNTVLQTLSEGVVVTDLAGRQLHVNRSARIMHGWETDAEAHQDIGRFDQIYELTGPEGAVLPLPEWPVSRILRGEVIRDLEIEVRKRDGNWTRIFNYSGQLARDESGAPLMAVITMFDTTERAKTRQRIQAQLESLRLLDQITRAIGDRLDLKSVFQVVLRTVEAELPAELCCIGLYEEDTDSLRFTCTGTWKESPDEDSIEKVDDNGLGECMGGQLVYLPDTGGSRYPFPKRLAAAGLKSVVLAPLRSESRVYGILVAARRITGGFESVECEFLRQLAEHVALAFSQTRLHAALQTAYDDLRHSQQVLLQEERLGALGRMASGIAHDINNALSPVSLYTDSLLETETGLSDRGRGYLETIRRAVEDIATTVTRMREFYRRRDDQVTLAPVDINEIIRQVTALTMPRWQDIPQREGVEIRVEFELGEGLPLVMGLENELRDALTNLVFNAVDAMPEGGRLTFRSYASSPGSSAVVVEVSDEGVGMDEATRQRCLEPFFTTKGERGTGLGLPMVFGTIQRHGAGIEVDSAPGEGTTLRLTFPVQAGADMEAGKPDTPGLPRPLRLLLVDDDPVLLRSLQETLQADGHTISVANGGADGIRLFESSLAVLPYEAVITDLGMPRVDGRQVAAAVKAAMPATPVILLTGWGRRLLAEGDTPPHVDALLAKPPRLRDLRETLVSLCGGQPGGPS